MPKSPFDLAYAKLNPNQKLAVDTTEGPVMVMAGPGTGKTQVLTLRIAHILKKTDTDPSSILALTFTEAAAREMKNRLIGLVGKDGYHVIVTTFHAFCADVIDENPDRFSRPAGMKNVTDLEKIEIISSILEEGSFLFLKPINDPTLYLKNIISSISDLKREGITLEKYASIVSSLTREFENEKDSLKKTAFSEREKLVGKNVDLLSIYKKYQENLERLGRYDYEDMINWVVSAFDSDPEFLLSYQEKLQYLLVDEYQDTNSAQNRLIFSLASFWGEGANVFVVGDPNQSIFRFQGASLENTSQFSKRYPNATKITLTDNYRSTDVLLASSAALINETQLTSNASHSPVKIKIAHLNSAVFEDEFLVQSIKSKIKRGVLPSDIAVIAKENKDIAHLSDLFKQKGIPYRLEGGTNVLATPLIGQLVKIFKVTTSLAGPVDDLELFTVLNLPCFKLEPVSVLKLSRRAYKEKIGLVDLLSRGEGVDEKVKEVFNLLISWNHHSASKTLPEMFQQILQESGLLNHILNLPQPIIELNRFGTLYEDAKSQVAAKPDLSLTGYVNNLILMEEHGLRLEEEPLSSAIPSVTLTTAHKAKGLEWLIVYVYRFADTHWGNKTVRQMIKLPSTIVESDLSKEDKNSEERRLFYVALTRAKQEVYLTGSSSYSHSTRMNFPAMFLSDLPENHRAKLKTDKYENKAAKVLAENLTPLSAPTIHPGEEEFLSDLIENFKLSPTALNTYLECAYKFKLDNLYRIPRAKAPAMCFGTAVHTALEGLYRKLGETGKIESKQDFLTDFENALTREVLTKVQFQDRLAHGRKILSAYYDHYYEEFKPPLFTERNFGLSLAREVLLGDIPLSGKSDRIDLIDKDKKQVRFVDYKTGAPKTRGVLEKEGEGNDGNYKRQLTFYHLLSNLDRSFDYKVIETELEFIEPDKSGHFHRERFNLGKEEVEKLKQVITKVFDQIRSLKFDRTTDTSICARCDFKSHCYPAGIPAE